jgi:hypothetical protein
MKTYLNKAFYRIFFLLFCLYGYVAHADPDVPGDDDYIPPPPIEKAPIDENIILILIVSLLFGIYIIYNHNVTKKRPI